MTADFSSSSGFESSGAASTTGGGGAGRKSSGLRGDRDQTALAISAAKGSKVSAGLAGVDGFLLKMKET